MTSDIKEFAVIETGVFPPNFVKWEQTEERARKLCVILKQRHPAANFEPHMDTYLRKADYPELFALPLCNHFVNMTVNSVEVKDIMEKFGDG